MKAFDEIRPYQDEEVRAVLRSLLQDPAVVDTVAVFLLPKFHAWLPGLTNTFVRRALTRTTRRLDSVYDVQTFLTGYFSRMIDETTSGYTVEGIERLDPGTGHLFISNHRDIALDSGFMNFALREAGLLEVIDNPVGELIDTWRSKAFAVCDHQIAHIYVRDDIERVRKVVERLDGFDRFIEIDHARSGELVALAAPGHWFAYPYWLDDARAPDFARTVDIHRKPGYDPCELFLDPKVSKAGLAWRLAKKTLGLRTIFDVVPLDPSLVGGTHGRLPASAEDGPVLLGAGDDRPRDMAEVKQEILRALGEPRGPSGT